MASISRGMEALGEILLKRSPEEAKAFIHSAIGNSAGVKGATNIVGDMQYHYKKAMEVAGGRSKDFVSEMGNLGQYGYSAEDAKKLLSAARGWEPVGKSGQSVMHGEVDVSPAAKDSGQIFYGTTNGSVATSEADLKRLNREERIARAHARHANSDSPGVLYAGTDGAAATTKEQMIQGARERIRGATNFNKGTRTLGEDGKPITQLEAGYNAMRDGDMATAKSIARHNNKVDGMKNQGADTNAYEQHYAHAQEQAGIKARVQENIRKNQEVRAAIQKGSVHEGHEGGFSKFAADEAKEPVSSPMAKPAFSVVDSPVADTKFAGGVGQEAANTAQATPGKVQETFQKAYDEAHPKTETNKPAPQETEFGGGAGSDDGMNDFFTGKLEAKGLSNADRHKINRVKNDYENYSAEVANAKGSEEELTKIRDRYGIKSGTDPMEHFKGQANGDATTMDWIMGNNVPQYAAGTMLLGGAVASCFSNKGKMSNSELYGQNF